MTIMLGWSAEKRADEINQVRATKRRMGRFMVTLAAAYETFPRSGVKVKTGHWPSP